MFRRKKHFPNEYTPGVSVVWEGKLHIVRSVHTNTDANGHRTFIAHMPFTLEDPEMIPPFDVSEIPPNCTLTLDFSKPASPVTPSPKPAGSYV